jgi:hypothetical protein
MTDHAVDAPGGRPSFLVNFSVGTKIGLVVGFCMLMLAVSVGTLDLPTKSGGIF